MYFDEGTNENEFVDNNEGFAKDDDKDFFFDSLETFSGEEEIEGHFQALKEFKEGDSIALNAGREIMKPHVGKYLLVAAGRCVDAQQEL